jgi:hypothetical protein
MATKKVLVVTKKSGLKADGSPKKSWINFIQKASNFNSKKVEDWSYPECVGYLFHKIKSHCGVEMTYSYSGAPSASSESYLIRRIMAELNTDSSLTFKEYIDWLFDQSNIPKTISSTGFFLKTNMASKFLSSKNKKLSRSSQIPKEYEDVAEALGISILTYGDIAFAKMAIENNPGSYPEYESFLSKIKDLGFDDNLLSVLAS